MGTSAVESAQETLGDAAEKGKDMGSSAVDDRADCKARLPTRRKTLVRMQWRQVKRRQLALRTRAAKSAVMLYRKARN
jgi:hypothetical protein